jgi:NAD-dependent deacetylase
MRYRLGVAEPPATELKKNEHGSGMSDSSVKNIVILTGAGISAESGVATFRAADGLWEGHRIEDVATPEAFVRDPALVLTFYDARRAKLDTVVPNAAHFALARLDAEWPGELLLVTQNVDDLHERAGSKRLIHMHGELKRGWCLACDARHVWNGPMGTDASCSSCGQRGQLRPDIVWFGEMPYDMECIEAALQRCDLFVSIGTSGAVYPAAGFVQTARYCGAQTLEINLDPSQGSIFFHESRLGRAGELVPAWVDDLFAEDIATIPVASKRTRYRA